MKKIKCGCGWSGNKYEVLVSVLGFACPNCEALIPDNLVLTNKDKAKLKNFPSKVSKSTVLIKSKRYPHPCPQKR